MPKALITLPNGTTITVEGDIHDLQQLLDYYGGQRKDETGRAPETGRAQKKKNRRVKVDQAEKVRAADENAEPPLTEIVNLIKNCDEAEQIEKQILDRTSQINRILLPLYVVHQHQKNAHGLTSGDINKITAELGIPIHTANVSHALSGSAARYVMGDKVRRRGQPVRYKLSRRGVKYLAAVIAGKPEDE
jgi:hypothetical protein